MGGRRIRVEMALLDVLAVVALGVREPEQPLLQDRVPAVPQREGEAQAALAVGDAQEPVLAPAVGAAARLLVREVAPALAVRGVVLSHGAPLPLREIGAPALPVPRAQAVLGQAGLLGVWGCLTGHGLGLVRPHKLAKAAAPVAKKIAPPANRPAGRRAQRSLRMASTPALLATA